MLTLLENTTTKNPHLYFTVSRFYEKMKHIVRVSLHKVAYKHNIEMLNKAVPERKFDRKEM